MEVRYIHKKNYIKGCVVILDDGRIGYSLCHPNDKKKSTKKLAREIAISRAEARNTTVTPKDNRHVWSRDNGKAKWVPHTVTSVIHKMLKEREEYHD